MTGTSQKPPTAHHLPRKLNRNHPTEKRIEGGTGSGEDDAVKEMTRRCCDLCDLPQKLYAHGALSFKRCQLRYGRPMEDPAASASLRQTQPVKRPLPEAPSEDVLRSLYPHPPGMVRLGMIAGKGGEATGEDGSSRSLSGPVDLRIVRVLRAAADVVVVGAATALREHYGAIDIQKALASTRGSGQTRSPLLAIVGFTGSLPRGLGPGNTLLLTTVDAPATSLVDEWGDSLVLVGRQSVSPHLLVSSLSDRGLPRILCEGGPALARLLLDAGVVTDYCLTESTALGDENGPLTPEVPQGWKAAHTLRSNGFTMTRWCNPRA